MCGICGIIDLDGRPVREELIHNMCAALVHRGPDDQGVYTSSQSKPSVGLGHRRLKIIDLSQAGHQPMANEDKAIRIVFNGEIYNYKNLRRELEGKGHIFKSNTDTETIIHLYEEYGADCVVHLQGMFAFTIWDEKKQTLLAARDRVGQKPLLYYFNGSEFCFASEFTSLLANGLVEKRINSEAIDYYLTFGYIPAPLTIYKDVFKLPPAHFLLLKDKKITIKQYWHLDYSKKLDISEEDAADEVIRLLREATKVRLHSDVPLGAFLSGGIDSSIVVALMSQVSGRRIKTFSIGFKEGDFSELGYARCIAERFDTEHREFIVRPKAIDIIPLLIERYGEPYADSSCIPTFYVAQQTRQFVTVALNGDGGDELFAGYERYQAMEAAETYQKMPAMVRKVINGSAAILPDSINSKNRLRRVKRFFDGAALPLQQRYLKWVGIFDQNFKKDIYSGDFSALISQADPLQFAAPFLNNSDQLSLLDSLLYADTMTYLPNDLLVKVDITSMANSLEARSPFLDHKLMEFVAKLPTEYKMRRFKKKYILKKAAGNLIPRKNIRRRKMGFGVPIGEWFRNELKDFLRETLLSTTSLGRGYFKSAAINTMVKQHISKEKDCTFQLWTLLMLELWHQRFID